MMGRQSHWETVYATKPADTVSWFQATADRSLALIGESALPLSASIIDVGGGASTLVDDLLRLGYSTLTVLDISGAALDVARCRLGPARSESVRWIEADITSVSLLPHAYDLWHDRAVFHFLTDADDRRRYIGQLRNALRPEGHLIIATFAEDGPERCSGLPVVRYSAAALQAELGPSFVLVSASREAHRTPGGTVQAFQYCHFKRQDAP